MHDNAPATHQSPDEYVEHLYRTHAGAARKAVLQILGNDPDAADDIVQIAFIRILNACRAGALTDCNRNYILLAARNAAIDHLRMTGKHQFVPLPITTPDSQRLAPDRSIERRELRLALETAVAELPERCRAVTELCFLREHSQPEAAIELGMSQKAVEKQIRRARTKLRKQLRAFCRAQSTERTTAGGGMRIHRYRKSDRPRQAAYQR